MADFKTYIAKVATGASLTRDEAQAAFDIVMSGDASPSQIGGFLMCLRVRGETVDEITGAVAAMRAKMLTVEAPGDALDIVGTGGDASGTYNISTAAALTVAGCGVPLAKHGNRALTSKSGAADTLAELGVNLEIGPAQITQCIAKAGIGFMFAPAHHAAMRHVGPSRVELGTRTIFNLLGPLCNPASAKRQMLGVFAPEWVEPLANVLKNHGSTQAWVVHGSDGLDELTTTGASSVAQLRDGKITTFEVTPEDAGLARAKPDDLKGGDPAHNAAAIRAVLAGQDSPFRHIVLLNAAAGLIVADRAENWKDGVAQAAQALDSGAVASVLEKLVATSNQ
ncbi:MAG: anthranilate phosphoribosyltransferase [Alphaproteobacteria bacterium]